MNMKKSKVLKTILFVSGLIATVIGGVILFMPVAFFATNGIELGNNPILRAATQNQEANHAR